MSQRLPRQKPAKKETKYVDSPYICVEITFELYCMFVDPDTCLRIRACARGNYLSPARAGDYDFCARTRTRTLEQTQASAG